MNTTQTESCNWQGIDYVAAHVSPRGFTNEHCVYVARADDTAGVARLQATVDKSVNRGVGDGYRAYWMSGQDIARHIHSQRAHDGAIYLLTLDADGNRDLIIL